MSKSTLRDILPPGVITGDDVINLLRFAKHKGFALPAVNCTSSSTVNAALAAARDAKSPLFVQFSYGGSAFYAGHTVDNKNHQGSVQGAVAGALHVRQMAEYYGVPVILHTDHCPEQHLPWLDGMLEADKKYKDQHGVPLFSSHMVDLSEMPDEQNISITRKYLEKCAALGICLEMEIGITGGVEDGQNNEGVDNSKLYTSGDDVHKVYKALSAPVKTDSGSVDGFFTIAAAFGNVHGVYKPGNVTLKPELLGEFQEFVKKAEKLKEDKPVYFVFHGGSGSSTEDIKKGVSHGVIKMNIDTDTQWAYWDGLRGYEKKNRGYLQGQIGNPDGPDKPNKGYYDPRKWLKVCEKSMTERLQRSFADLNSMNSLDLVFDLEEVMDGNL